MSKTDLLTFHPKPVTLYRISLYPGVHAKNQARAKPVFLSVSSPRTHTHRHIHYQCVLFFTPQCEHSVTSPSLWSKPPNYFSSSLETVRVRILDCHVATAAAWPVPLPVLASCAAAHGCPPACLSTPGWLCSALCPLCSLSPSTSSPTCLSPLQKGLSSPSIWHWPEQKPCLSCACHSAIVVKWMNGCTAGIWEVGGWEKY